MATQVIGAALNAAHNKASRCARQNVIAGGSRRVGRVGQLDGAADVDAVGVIELLLVRKRQVEAVAIGE